LRQSISVLIEINFSECQLESEVLNLNPWTRTATAGHELENF
jgi:hypothetical protein